MVEKLDRLIEAAIRFFETGSKLHEIMATTPIDYPSTEEAKKEAPKSPAPAPEKDEAPTEEEPEPQETAKQKRDRLKARARELGIVFGASIRTASLEKLIEREEAKTEEKPDLAAAPTKAEKEAVSREVQEMASDMAGVTPVTRADAQALLVKISMKVSKDAALAAIEAAVPGCKKLKEVPEDPTNWAAIVRECGKVLNNASE